MPIITPQAQGIRAGGIRKKQLNPYVDMIRGQYGQATQNVLAQKQEAEKEAARKQDVHMANRTYQLQKDQFKLQKDVAQQESMASKIGLGLDVAKTGLNIWNQGGGSWGGVAKMAKDFGGGLWSSFSSLF